ncbi:MAG: hypothetical protein IT367_03020 [Candidatus Hydrogenedentes bacterium]|nr:hypothetical protein [Candidatus Hydrogenedentota bacterium]
MENAKGYPMTDALIPLAALVRRELLRTLRVSRSLYLLALLVGIPAVSVRVVWPMSDDPVFFVHRATVLIPQFCIVGLFIAAVLTLPAQAATAVRGERDRDTLTLLLLTRISPRAMLVGHVLNCFGLFALYAIATMPIVCSVYLLTGLDWQTIPLQYAVIGVTALDCIVAGLVCTAFATSTPRAVIGAFLLSAFMLGGYVQIFFIITQLVCFGIFGIEKNPFRESIDMLWQASPPSLLLQHFGTRSVFMGTQPYLSGIVVHTALAIIGATFAWIGFVRLHKETVAPLSERASKKSILRTGPKDRLKSFSDTYNAVFQREYRVLMQGWWRTRRLRIGTFILAGTVFAVTLGIVFLVDNDLYGQEGMEYEVMMAWMMGCIAVICMVAPGVSTPLWIRERDQETREQLIMTLLRPKQIIFGKAAAAVVVTLFAAGIWMVSSSPLLARGLFFSWKSWTPVLPGVPMLIMLALTLVAIGSQTPHMRVNSTVAIALSYAFGIAYIAFPVFFPEVYYAMMMKDQTRLFSQIITMAISPFGSWVAGIDLAPRAEISPILYWPGALAFQLLAAYWFLRDSIRNENTKIRKGSAS